MKSITTKAARKKLGEKIRVLRKAQDISQKQLGFEAGLSREEISYLEGGHKNVTLDTLLVIAAALDIHIKDLFDFDY